MDETHIHTSDGKDIAINERWFSEWFEYGMQELCEYLARHAAFDAYLAQRTSAA